MLTFRNTVLLGRVRARHTVRDAGVLKIAMELVILTAPIRLNRLDFSTQKAFNMSMETIEDPLNIRHVLKKGRSSKNESNHR